MFHPRCAQVMEICRSREPATTQIAPGHFVRCLLYEDLDQQGETIGLTKNPFEN
jgi:hypothetical protein